jgi:hypothetical protein
MEIVAISIAVPSPTAGALQDQRPGRAQIAAPITSEVKEIATAIEKAAIYEGPRGRVPRRLVSAARKGSECAAAKSMGIVDAGGAAGRRESAQRVLRRY